MSKRAFATETATDQPVQSPEVLVVPLKDDGTTPNNKLPLLVYRGAVQIPERDPAAVFEHLFAAHGWVDSWRDGIYSYHHYHSTAHEVLGIYRGSAKVQLGGEHGVIQEVRSGDVIVIPAGVAHKNLGSSEDLGVVGAYPEGQEADMNNGKPEERPRADRNIAQVALPKADPVYGAEGPLTENWGKR